MAKNLRLTLTLENYSFEQIEQLAQLLIEMEELEAADKLYQYLVANQALLT